MGLLLLLLLHNQTGAAAGGDGVIVIVMIVLVNFVAATGIVTDGDTVYLELHVSILPGGSGFALFIHYLFLSAVTAACLPFRLGVHLRGVENASKAAPITATAVESSPSSNNTKQQAKGADKKNKSRFSADDVGSDGWNAARSIGEKSKGRWSSDGGGGGGGGTGQGKRVGEGRGGGKAGASKVCGGREISEGL